MKDGWASHLITSLLTALVGRPPPAILACPCVYDVNDFIRMSLENVLRCQDSPHPPQSKHCILACPAQTPMHAMNFMLSAKQSHVLPPNPPAAAATIRHPGSSSPPSLLPPWFLHSLLLRVTAWARVTWPPSSTRGWVDGRGGEAAWRCDGPACRAANELVRRMERGGRNRTLPGFPEDVFSRVSRGVQNLLLSHLWLRAMEQREEPVHRHSVPSE